MKRFLVTVKLKRQAADEVLTEIIAAVPDAIWISVRHDSKILAQYSAPVTPKTVDNEPGSTV